jgi:hypothetical protein
MSAAQDHRELGMHRPIARRDFLNGVAIGVASEVSARNSARAQGPQAAGTPPLSTGLRGRLLFLMALSRKNMKNVSIPPER